MRFTHLTSEQGLAQNRVEVFLQDKRGFLWVGTRNGLSRFDGYRFVNYTHDPNNPNSLSHNGVLSLFEDRDGMLWIGTRGGGVNRFDPVTERFTHYIHRPNDPLSLGGLAVHTIFQDRQGNFWFGGPPRAGLTKITFDLANTDELVPLAATHYSTSQDGANTFQGAIWKIVADGDGVLWMSTDNALVKIESQAQGERFTTYKAPHPNENRMSTLYQDRAGNLWAGGTQGLYKFDPRTTRFKTYPPPGSPINQIEVAQDGTLWLGTLRGLYRFDPRTEQFAVAAVADPTSPQSLNDNQIHALYRDRADVLWVGTVFGGINMLDPRHNRFAHYRWLPSAPDGLAPGPVGAIVGEGTHGVWVAIGTGLNQVDWTTGGVTHWELPASRHAQDLVIEALMRDHQAQIWVGVGTELYALDPSSGVFTPWPLPPPPTNGQARPPASVVAIREDHAGALWVGVLRGGLYRIDPTRTEIRRFEVAHTMLNPQETEPRNALPLDRVINELITSLALDENGHLWIGYETGELSRLDPQTETFRHYLPTPGRPGLGGTIQDIVVARNGLVWVAAHDGLVRFDPATELDRLYTEHDGLPTSFVTAVLEDQAGQLWLSTKKGLSRFDPPTEQFRNYDVVDGLQGNEFLSRSAWQALDGQMFFGGINGFTAFYPSQIRDDIYQPPVVLTELRLFNEPVQVGPDSLLTRALWATDHLTLNHDQRGLSFEFAALSFAAASKNRYRYRLEGLESTWNEVDSSRRFATYTSLPAGSYVLRVQGSNADGIWSEHEATFALTVLPPWWQTLWFQAFVVAVLVAGVYAGHRWRLHTIERRNGHLERLVHERTRDLAESEARFKGLASSSFEAMLLYDQGRILDVNQAAVELFGYPQEALIGKQLSDLLAPESLVLLVQRGGSQEPYEVTGVTATGALIPLEVRDRVVPRQGREVQVAVIRDLTERRQIEAQRERLVVLTERERIGRELHDDLGQVMGYIVVQSQTVEALVEEGEAAQAHATLARVIRVAQQAHETVRQYILDVRGGGVQPPENFLAALEQTLQRFERSYGLQTLVSWPAELTDSPLAPEVEAQLLKIIQEALTNVLKHANTETAQLLFTLHPDEFQVIIADEGQGFVLEQGGEAQLPPLHMPEHPAKQAPLSSENGGYGHFGLNIMRERAASVGGTLEVRSTPGQGTKVVARLPRMVAQDQPLSTKELRVMLVDDHPLYLEGLRNILSTRGIQVVGTARDGLEAQEMAATLRPDLILMDVEMPRCDGLEATRQIKAADPSVKIVMLTVAVADELLFKAFKYGASGYLLKNLDRAQLFTLIQEVMRGEMVLSPTLAARVLSEFAQMRKDTTQALTNGGGTSALTNGGGAAMLTPRQYEVLRLVAQGRSNKEIAAELQVSETTVKYHMGQIMERLQMRSRYEVAAYARTHGLISAAE